MPEPLIHFIIPFFILIMLGFNLKKSALISSFAVIPDLDVLFHVHRSISHSIFFILILSIPIIIVLKKIRKNNQRLYRDAIITTLVVLSHPFMDMFTYFTPILWPIFNKSVYIFTELTTKMNNVLDLNLIFNLKFEKVIFLKTTDSDAPIFTSQGIGMSLVLLTGLALKYLSVRFNTVTGLMRYAFIDLEKKVKNKK